jgi:pyruvate/2-oxoglutarate dehydrogenase complex dihydrolipoamide acyltransferase (E2) component
MSDTEGTSPASETPREGVTGRYVRGRQDGKSGDDPKPAQGGGGTPPPAGGTPPPAAGDAQAGKDDEKEGRKRWLLLLLLLLILLLLLCAGFVYMKWFNKPKAEPPAASPSAVSTTTAAPKPSPSPSVSVSPTQAPPKTVAMPDVVGKPASEAKTILEAAGFTSIKFVDETKPNDSLSLLVSYVVTKQSVAPGTQVPADTALVITAKTSSSGKG